MSAPLDQLFGSHRRLLWSVSYRMTGNAADADDIVQETFVRMMERPPARTNESLRPWLVKVALNLSRDLLRRRKRHEYVGPWLPSPIPTDEEPAPPSYEPVVDGRTLEDRYDLLESVSFAFLIALEELTPTQRAVLLLRDVFDYSVAETADALDLSEANVKTTHHRARKAMAAYNGARVIAAASVEEATRQALTQFLQCLERNDVAGVEALLAEDVRTLTDGGGEFQAALRPIIGRDKVTRFYFAINPRRQGTVATITALNGLASIVGVLPGAAAPVAPRYSVSIDLDRRGKIAHIYVVSASRKLTALAPAFERLASGKSACSAEPLNREP